MDEIINNAIIEHYGNKINADIYAIWMTLNEVYHINTTFYKCINDIER